MNALRFALLAVVPFLYSTTFCQPLPSAQVPAVNVFSAALVRGQANGPAPIKTLSMERVLEAMRQSTPSKEPVLILAERVMIFRQQPRCGRVRFALGQVESKRIWPTFGGELNICEDGLPPLRMCPEQQMVLVPANGHCSGGTSPVDTPEVTAAIQAAYAAGGLSQSDMMKKWKATRDVLPATAASSSLAGQMPSLRGAKDAH